MTLTDGNLSLRAPEPGDLDSIYLLENDTRAWVEGDTTAPLSRKQLWDYINNYDGNIFTCGQLRLVITVDGELAGIVDLYDYNRMARRAYVGIIVKEQYREAGVASRALALMVDYASTRLDMRQLAAIVRKGNIASERLFAAAGFYTSGIFPNWIHTSDAWVDALHLQMELAKPATPAP